MGKGKLLPTTPGDPELIVRGGDRLFPGRLRCRLANLILASPRPPSVLTPLSRLASSSAPLVPRVEARSISVSAPATMQSMHSPDTDVFSTPPSTPGVDALPPSLRRRTSRPSHLRIQHAAPDWANNIVLDQQQSPDLKRTHPSPRPCANGSHSSSATANVTATATQTAVSASASESDALGTGPGASLTHPAGLAASPSLALPGRPHHTHAPPSALHHHPSPSPPPSPSPSPSLSLSPRTATSPYFVHSQLQGVSIQDFLHAKKCKAIHDARMEHARNCPSDSDPYSARSSSEFDAADDDYDAGSLTRQLAETAVGVREMSKQLGRTRVHSHIHTVLIVTKARDNRLINLTRELALYLMRKPTHTGRGMVVYVDAQLKTSRRFDAAGMQRDFPELFAPFPRRRESNSSNASAGSGAANQENGQQHPLGEGQLRYWTAEMCSRSPHLFDFVVTLGGDGTVLFTSWLFQRIVPPVLPFALGSLGFLTNFDFADYAAVMDSTLDNGIRVNLRMRFTCTVYRAVKPEDERTSRRAVKKGDTGEILMKNLEKGGWEALESGCAPAHDTAAGPGASKKDKEIMCFTTRPVESFEVLNDLVVDRGPSPYVSLLELFGDEHHLTTVQADGLTISTPTGSTAYSLSAGGSLVHPEIPAILITPICPHTLSFRPMLLPDSMELRICVPFNSRSTAWASFDGRGRVELKQGDHIKVTASKYPFPTVCADTQSTDWFNSISRTLKWNERERQKSFVVVEEGPAQKKDKKRRLSEASENGGSVNGDHANGEEADEDEDEEEEEEEDEKFDIDDLSSTESSPPRVAAKLEENLLQPEEARIGKEKVIESANGGEKATSDVQARAEDVARLLTANNPFLQIPHAKSGVESGIETPDRFTGPHPHPPRVSPRHVQFAQSNDSSSGSLASLDPRHAAAPAPPFRRDLRDEGGRSQTRRSGTSRSRTPRTRDPELEAQKTPRGFDEARMRRAMSRSRSRDARREPRETHVRRAFAVWGQDESDSAASDNDA
ncbi:ATP-NAD kinase [Daedalea quercina L-15889]|uniref:ATP-NAD kinase n=1 Tax=Daedalea quercina L-15889 TaxID=1314783 RepID=A0A165NP77_9APHY|nr:ATP-NAD kinase [Daedalea quercina L-15889]